MPDTVRIERIERPVRINFVGRAAPLIVRRREVVVMREAAQGPPGVPGAQGVAGPQGSAGATGASAAGVRHNFSFGDATPASMYTAPAGAILLSITLVIVVPFNGTGSALRVNRSGGGGAVLMAETENDPKVAATYEVTPARTLAAGETITLTIIPGAGCTQGAGFLVLEII